MSTLKVRSVKVPFSDEDFRIAGCWGGWNLRGYSIFLNTNLDFLQPIAIHQRSKYGGVDRIGYSKFTPPAYILTVRYHRGKVSADFDPGLSTLSELTKGLSIANEFVLEEKLWPERLRYPRELLRLLFHVEVPIFYEAGWYLLSSSGNWVREKEII
jgi:hypothetical protein